MSTRVRTTSKIRFGSLSDIPKTYVGLVSLYLPRPIRTAGENARATAMLDALAVFEGLNTEQQDYLDALAHFISDFEKPLSPKVSGLKALKFLVEENGLSARELSRILGASPMLGGMILRGEREITASHARTLGKHFAVDPGLFL